MAMRLNPDRQVTPDMLSCYMPQRTPLPTIEKTRGNRLQKRILTGIPRARLCILFLPESAKTPVIPVHQVLAGTTLEKEYQVMYTFSPFHTAFHFFIRLHASGGFHL